MTIFDLESDSQSTPAEVWDSESKKRALDELFTSARRYSSSKDYFDLIQFVRRFKRYSPFNAMLVHIQKPGARYVLRASEWEDKYNRKLLPAAQPLVALQPMSPVMFLFDVSDTEGAPLPREIESPFEPRCGCVGKELEQTLVNCARDGIRVHYVRQGSQAAGSIRPVDAQMTVLGRSTIEFRGKQIPVEYELVLSESMTREAQYGTLVHELGHLYCGHLGSRNQKWWPNRQGLELKIREFEAESVSYLVCQRLGIDSPSEEYLNGYLKVNGNVPDISLERVFVVSGLIEQMGKKRLPLRKIEG